MGRIRKYKTKVNLPLEDEIIDGGTIEWSGKVWRERPNSGHGFYEVAIACSDCFEKRYAQAHSVLCYLKKGVFHGRCAECHRKYMAIRNEVAYRNRGLEKLGNGVEIDWNTIQREANTRRFLVHTKCRCGMVRITGACRSGKLCQPCSRIDRAIREGADWKDRSYISRGYRYVYISPEHPMLEMSHTMHINGWGSLMEHRLVAAMSVGRKLESWEHVHHRDGDKLNNDPSNLEVVSPKDHFSVTKLQMEVYKLRRNNKKLKTEAETLRGSGIFLDQGYPG